MSKPSKKAIAILKRVKAEIMKEPRRFSMHAWIDNHDPIAPCGTTACIAGFICAIVEMDKGRAWVDATGDLLYASVQRKASHLIGQRQIHSGAVFFSSCWPARFKKPYDRTPSRKTKAIIACKRIDYFCRTGK